MSKRLRLLIVDDQTLMREGLKTILALEEDFDVAGTAEDGVAALDLLAGDKVDLVLMDVRMPRMNGVECTREIAARFPDTKVLILSTFAEDEAIYDALRAGAVGYLLKDLPSEKLVSAIREAVSGMVSMQPEVMQSLLSRAPRGETKGKGEIKERLTAREWEILCLMSEGLSNKEISGRLYISEGTVKNYISTIYEKLQVKDRTQAVLLLKG
ncbi:MAG TPA: response regulator transcription factor [Bacillota bacterium]|nr:response regulator transcription factor [Bacillota bacterium]